MMDNNKPLMAHLSMFTACAIWGLMAPIGKDAMLHGIDGITMVSFRVMGGALLFWLLSACKGLWQRRSKDTGDAVFKAIPLRDKLMFAGAAIFGLVCNQCGFTIGLSYTSPANASIITTAMPIFTMLLSFLILREPITWKKAGGVAFGCIGALTLILTSVSAADAKVGNIRGDVMVLCAQLSYALFLSLFNPFVRRYPMLTVNRWMFLWATFLIWPFTVWHVAALPWTEIALKTWLEVAYVVVFGTFLGYIFIVNAQKVLRPTVVSIYNYVQPLVSVTVSVLTGIGVFKPTQGLAVFLVFLGVWMVTKSKSRRDAEKEG